MLLFVTQISLLDEEAFGRASTLLKEAKVNSMPFGGVRVIVVGDFAQLPTVHCNEPRPPLLFDHDSWNECDFHIVYLSQKRRCEDDGSVRCVPLHAFAVHHIINAGHTSLCLLHVCAVGCATRVTSSRTITSSAEWLSLHYVAFACGYCELHV